MPARLAEARIAMAMRLMVEEKVPPAAIIDGAVGALFAFASLADESAEAARLLRAAAEQADADAKRIAEFRLAAASPAGRA